MPKAASGTSKAKTGAKAVRGNHRRPGSAPKKFDSVPMLDLSRQYAAIGDEVNEAVTRVCASQQYILGPAVQEFEKEACAFLNVQHAVGCASGTDALWLALLAAGVGPGDEVITTPFSFFATASSIVRAGARPVFVDVEHDTLNIDPERVEQRIKQTYSARLKAVMPVHLYGQCADMDRLNRIAADHKLIVIEDAAQAFGATWRGRHAGALSVLGAFSFYPTKNLSCYGDGGLVTCESKETAAQLRRLRNHGSSRRYYHEELGWNSRLDSLQAAILRVKLKYVNEWNAKRNQRATAYDVLLKSAGLLSARGRKPMHCAPIALLSQRRESFHIYHQYVVRADRRDELRAFLTERKIGSEVYYPFPLHLQQCFAYLGYASGELPQAEQAAHEVIALPLFPEITAAEQATVVNAIAEFYS
jgi:dTDP-4-amino-4,6-dideoxygalactose transaminase